MQMDSKPDYSINNPFLTDSRNSLSSSQVSSESEFVTKYGIQWSDTGPTIINNSQPKRDPLGKAHVAAYAVGHFSNDLCSSAWFTYVLYYI